ncbi:MAG: phage holin family protein [Clostridiales bacterium]|nr:phage holin family protein [Clostridiales bacterium]
MDNQKSSSRSTTADWTVAGIVIRLIASAVVLAITAFLVPEFSISGIGPLVIAAIVLTVMDYLFVKLLGIEASPFGRGIVGFVSAAIILYLTQFFVPGYSITILSAIIGAIVYGIVTYLIPGGEAL